jgi:hypothetical protein
MQHCTPRTSEHLLSCCKRACDLALSGLQTVHSSMQGNSMTRAIRVLLRSLTGRFARQTLRLRRRCPSVEVTLDTKLLRLPPDGSDGQWIAEIEEHLRGCKDLQAPRMHVPKQLGPLC